MRGGKRGPERVTGQEGGRVEKVKGMTDLQFATFLRMIRQVLDGCRDLGEA